ncbi:hypothetical protein B0J17DRAFT_716867 [Rhizoctonia solani]|nr:hypothetical protein B0J17DRAFT_716867 [Rhizoctonia solani]
MSHVPYEYQIVITLPLKPDLAHYNMSVPQGPWRPPTTSKPAATYPCTTAPINVQDSMKFFSMFISPSLTDIRTIIPKALPQILDLSRNSSTRVLPGRHPHIQGHILEPELLRILGQLPHLESLGIRGMPETPPVLHKKLSIPDTWFPALKDLRLYELYYTDIQALWGQPNIVKNLVYGEIQIEPSAELSEWAPPFIQALLSLSPHLEDFGFYVAMGYQGRLERIPTMKKHLAADTI